MESKKPSSFYMRLIHRYLGFFLVGIMAIYSISGVVLIFRNTDTFKKEVVETKTFETGLNEKELGGLLRIRDLKIDRQEGSVMHFKTGTYDTSTGVASHTKMELPFVLDKLTHLHKANTTHKLYYFNIFFGVCLFFFVLSAFWMFLPSSKVFKKGMYFTLAGILFTLFILFF